MNNGKYLLLWDIDGTLLDFLQTEKWAIRNGFKRLNLGECTDSMLARYSAINRSYWEKLERGEMAKEQILINRFRDFFSEYNLPVEQASTFNKNYQLDLGEKIFFMQDAMEVLNTLQASDRFIQCAVTNGTKTAQSKKLVNSGLNKIFNKVFISDEIGYEKPNPLFFEAIKKAYPEFSLQNTMIIGDSLTSDIKGGNNAAIKTCWFNPFKKEKDRNVHIDYEISCLKDFLNIADRLI